MMLFYAAHAALIGGLVFMVIYDEPEFSRLRAIAYSIVAGALWPVTVDAMFVGLAIFIIIGKRVYRL